MAVRSCTATDPDSTPMAVRVPCLYAISPKANKREKCVDGTPSNTGGRKAETMLST